MPQAGRHGEIRSLTGLRGVAALYVVIYHLDLGQNDASLIQHLLHHGYLSVDLFFVLSGFVLALTSRRLLAGRIARADYLRFLGNRLARIYPLYLFSTLLYLVLFALHHGVAAWPRRDWVEVGSNLLLVQAWDVADSINGVAWSISTEWLAYLLFPLLAWLAFSRRPWLAAAVGVACVVTLALMAFAPDLPLWHDMQLRQGPLDRADPASIAPVLRCLAEFTLGLLTFRVAASHRAAQTLRTPALGLAVCAALFALLALRNTDLPIVLLYPVLILVLATDTGIPARLLGSPVLHRLGVISYSIYLLHPFVLWPGTMMIRSALLEWHMPAPTALALLAVLLLSLAVALMAQSVIEAPARRLIRRYV